MVVGYRLRPAAGAARLLLTAIVLGVGGPARAEQPAADALAQPGDAVAGRIILNGYRRYQATCAHCHGPDGVGSTFAPSLIEAPLLLARFERIVRDGSVSGTSAMQGFRNDPNVEPYVRDIYAYLQARADGAIGRGRPALKP
jgi:mono/diheme cytochrome c family protein